MNSPKVLFSTTQGWNPGDEIIFLGIINILKDLGYSFKPIIYNRSPFTFNATHARVDLKADSPDYVVFAGSPEWWQEIVAPRHALFSVWPLRRIAAAFTPGRAERANDLLLNELLTTNRRCSFIGVGSSKKPVPGPKLTRVLQKHCDLLITRDRQTADVFASWSPQLMPCPALFAAASAPRESVRRVGLTLQKPNRGLIRIKRSETEWIDAQVRTFLEQAPDAELIAHTPWDVEYLTGKYPERVVHAALTGADLIACYAKFDFIASTRLHGCILACALGIPVYQLHYGERMEALDQFPVLQRDRHGSLPEAFASLDVIAWSTALRTFKKQVHGEYMNALEPLSYLFKGS